MALHLKLPEWTFEQKRDILEYYLLENRNLSPGHIGIRASDGRLLLSLKCRRGLSEFLVFLDCTSVIVVGNAEEVKLNLDVELKPYLEAFQRFLSIREPETKPLAY